MKSILLSTILAVLAAAALIYTGIDWRWAKLSENVILLQYIGIPSVFIGILVPGAMPLYLYLKRKQQPHYSAMSAAAFKAFLAAWGYSTLLKAFTNRVPREPFEALGMTDLSGQFRLGFLQGNNLWESLIEGFPSGHTMTAFAMSVAVLPFMASGTKRTLAILYAVYIGLGVSLTVHWLSDAVAGGLIGYALGKMIAATKFV